MKHWSAGIGIRRRNLLCERGAEVRAFFGYGRRRSGRPGRERRGNLRVERRRSECQRQRDCQRAQDAGSKNRRRAMMTGNVQTRWTVAACPFVEHPSVSFRDNAVIPAGEVATALPSLAERRFASRNAVRVQNRDRKGQKCPTENSQERNFTD